MAAMFCRRSRERLRQVPQLFKRLAPAPRPIFLVALGGCGSESAEATVLEKEGKDTRTLWCVEITPRGGPAS